MLKILPLLIIINIFQLFHDYVFSQLQQLPIARTITSFCVGGQHACVVFSGKEMKCWGSGYGFGYLYEDIGDGQGELGDGMPYVNVSNNVGIEKVSCGFGNTCVKLNTNETKCFGGNYNGQAGLGLPVTTTPIGFTSGHIGDKLPVAKLGSGFQVQDISLGMDHVCVLVTGKRVKCYGSNVFAQLGLGDTTDRGSSLSLMGDNLPFVVFGTGAEVASIHASSSSQHNCVILLKPTASSQRIKCWGWNQYYQLGYGTKFGKDNRGDASGEMGDSLPLVDLGTESKVKQLALGYEYTCTLLVDDILKCFGYGYSGQLASGSTATISATGDGIPIVKIDSGKTIEQITAGDAHICIVYNDMVTMKCVGLNNFGQLGQGDLIARGNTPSTTFPNVTAIDLGTGSVKISSMKAGLTHTCVIFEDSRVKCFGRNDYAQLGIGFASSGIGYRSGDMGKNLTYVVFFSPTTAPTDVPTLNPTKSPSKNPTKSPTTAPTPPTSNPTSSPTRPCDYQSAKLCKYDIKCMWKKVNGVKKCIVFDCTTLNKGKCGKERKRCIWKKQTSLCEAK